MSIRKIGTALVGACLAFSLVACAPKNEEPMKVLTPAGAPALALLPLVEDENVVIETVQGTDVLAAELSKKDSDYDVIVAPTNLGAKIYSQAKTYSLEAVLTWGNLYLVGEQGADHQTEAIAAFGEKAVPQLVFNKVLDAQNLNVIYYASVQEAQQALLTKQQPIALLAQPAAAATIAKAKEQGRELTILADLQKLWQQKTDSKDAGYPQASLFVKEGVDASYIVKKLSKTTLSEKDMKQKIEAIGADTLGLPNAELAIKTYQQQHIHFEKGKDVKDQIEAFLTLFGMNCPDELIKS